MKVMTENIAINKQSSIRIAGEKIIYFDPWEVPGKVKEADIIFITHNHPDHYSLEDIKGLLKEDGILVVPEKMKDNVIKDTGFANEKILSVSPGNEYETIGISVKTVVSYNKMKPFHTKGAGWCGYIVTMDGISYYAMGDTDALNELMAVSCDVLFVPIGGKFTMNLKEAIAYTLSIKPKIAIPIHYGGIVGKPEDGLVFKETVEKENPKIKVELVLKV